MNVNCLRRLFDVSISSDEFYRVWHVFEQSVLMPLTNVAALNKCTIDRAVEMLKQR